MPEKTKPSLANEVSRYDIDSLKLDKGYSIVSIDLVRKPRQYVNPVTKQLEQERSFSCDFSMRIIKSDKYKESTEILLKANAELTPILISNSSIKQAIIRDIDIVAVVS